MKRTPLDRALRYIATTYPWLRWRSCYECGTDIKREAMWKIWVQRTYPSESGVIRVCMDCRPDMDTVLKKYINSKLYSQWKDRQKTDGPLRLP